MPNSRSGGACHPKGRSEAEESRSDLTGRGAEATPGHTISPERSSSRAISNCPNWTDHTPSSTASRPTRSPFSASLRKNDRLLNLMRPDPETSLISRCEGYSSFGSFLRKWSRRPAEFARRNGLSERLMRPLVVVERLKAIEALLLLPLISRWRSRRGSGQRGVHPLVCTILLRMAGVVDDRLNAQLHELYTQPADPRERVRIDKGHAVVALHRPGHAILAEYLPKDRPHSFEGGRSQCPASKQEPTGQVHHRERIAVDPVECFELSFEVDRSQLASRCRLVFASERRRRFPAPTSVGDQTVPFENVADRRRLRPHQIRMCRDEFDAQLLGTPAITLSRFNDHVLEIRRRVMRARLCDRRAVLQSAASVGPIAPCPIVQRGSRCLEALRDLSGRVLSAQPHQNHLFSLIHSCFSPGHHGLVKRRRRQKICQPWTRSVLLRRYPV